jgi:hypothetical protein
MDRNQTLLEAGRAIKDRGEQYGRAHDLFDLIAQRWRLTVLQRHKIDLSLTREDVGLMMVELKLARMLANPSHADSAIDAVGYLSLLNEFNTGQVPVSAPKPATPAPQVDTALLEDEITQIAKKFAPPADRNLQAQSKA